MKTQMTPREENAEIEEFEKSCHAEVEPARKWEEKMADLEAIHAEISPQVRALRIAIDFEPDWESWVEECAGYGISGGAIPVGLRP